MMTRRPRPLRNAALVALCAAALAVATLAVSPAQAAPAARPARLDAQPLLTLLNRDRAAHGLGPLVLDARLTAVAAAHSADMVARGYFAHLTPDGLDPFARIASAGIHYSAAAENIGMARAALPQVATAAAHALMMNEPAGQPNHRATILNPALHRVGLGLVHTASGAVYVTEDFTN